MALNLPAHVLAALAARGGPGGAPDLGPPGLPTGGPIAPGLDAGPPPGPPGLGLPGGPPDLGPPDPSTPDGATALLAPLMMAQQQQRDGLQQAQATSLAAAMASAMQNVSNPAGAAAATLPGEPTAPGSGLGGPAKPSMSAGFSPSAPPAGTY